MAEDVYRYRIHCFDEDVNYYDWRGDDESAPTECPSSPNHTVDVTIVQTVTKKDVRVADVENGLKLPVQEKDFPERTGWDFYVKGYAFTALAGQDTEFRASYADLIKLCGIGYVIGDVAVDGDHIEVCVKDVEGDYYPPGAVLATFAEDMFVKPGSSDRIICEDVKDIAPNLDICFEFHSTGGVDVPVKVLHFLRI